MTLKSKSLLNRIIIFIGLFCLWLFSLLWCYASKNKSCQFRTFNIKTNNQATGGELLMELAEMCDFSIVLKDAEAEKVLLKNLSGINIKDLSLDEIFML